MQACSSGDRAVLAIGSTAVKDTGTTLVTESSVMEWQAGPTGAWH
jgi:hypothetical protein